MKENTKYKILLFFQLENTKYKYKIQNTFAWSCPIYENLKRASTCKIGLFQWIEIACFKLKCIHNYVMQNATPGIAYTKQLGP